MWLAGGGFGYIVGVAGIYGCGKQEVSVSSGCGKQELSVSSGCI